MRALKTLGALVFLFVLTGLAAQPTFPYNGVYDQRDGHYAFTNATIVTAPGKQMENATLVIKDGKIAAVGAGISVPAGAVSIDLKGKYIYPSFIEPYGDYGVPEAKSERRYDRSPQFLSKTPGAYAWNQALRTEFAAHEHFTIDSGAAKKLREAGFGTVNSHRMDGISRGTATVVSLAETSPQEAILLPMSAHHLSTQPGTSPQDYPSSLMGSIALLRQTYIDAEWYKNQTKETNNSLAAWNEAMSLPQIMDARNWQYIFRLQPVADEFNQSYIYKGTGDEYQRAVQIKATGASLIIPLKFPKAYDVTDPYSARMATLGQLRHWERAPGNAAELNRAGIEIAFTSSGLDKASELLDAVRKSIEYGLTETAALHALTLAPAKMLKIDGMVGTLEKGKVASFLVTSGPLFDEKTAIHQNWVQGNPYELKEMNPTELASAYDLKIGKTTYKLNVEGEAGKQKIKLVESEDKSVDVKHEFSDGMISLSFQPSNLDGFIRINGVPTDQGYSGNGNDASGNWTSWAMTKAKAPSKKEEEKKKDAGKKESPTNYVGKLTHPIAGYGRAVGELKEGEKILIRNTTVWTNESDGVLKNTDVLVENGKISQIGKNLPSQGARIIDGKGKHLTPGIIDEHSHIALASVNEGSQASSAEVRMTDVIDETDINIYRQLSGGVTTSQLLHGSANPIGGQSAIVKLRWGKSAQEMVFAGADGFIKFALGENVKQSNWGDDQTERYPQTRMGVEQVFDSYFSRAKEYGEAKAKGGKDFRKDLDLEALLEILNDERFITCHSYQQGEINMLMQVADRHGFNVNTFTHILEGYKVADKMAKRGVGGSTFSDWWAYKYEVNEAIPYNAAIMHDQGVVVAINSDDDEMARRLNQEAAKSVLFGGISEEDALKFVTLNPAKLLHIDDQVGSIKTGKDADLVLWSDHPLSIYAVAENTLIDGVEYYSRENDEQMRMRIKQERNALIQKSLDAKKAGAETQAPKGKQKRRHHCDTLDHSDHSDHH